MATSGNQASAPGNTGNNTSTNNLGNNNSGAAVNAACGGAGSGTPVSVITPSSANLCNPGTVKDFAGSGPWSWTCQGINGGSDAPCTATQATDTDYGEGYLKNPLAPGLDTFPKIFAAVVNNIVLPIAVPFIAIMIIYSGFLFVSARKKGSTDDLKKAKETLQYTLIGAGLILGAFVIANALQATLGELLGPTTG